MVVLGLTAIFLAMVLAITVRVYNGTMNGVVMQQNVQAWLMMMAARKIVAGGSGPPANDITGGVEFGLFTPCGRIMAHSLGWFRIKGGSTLAIAVGGGSARNGSKESINAGDSLMNSCEVRLYYTIGVSAPYAPTLQPIADNSTYAW